MPLTEAKLTKVTSYRKQTKRGAMDDTENKEVLFSILLSTSDNLPEGARRSDRSAPVRGMQGWDRRVLASYTDQS